MTSPIEKAEAVLAEIKAGLDKAPDSVLVDGQQHSLIQDKDALRTILAGWEEMKAERDASFRANEADRTVVAEALADIKREVASRSWLCSSRGSYEWDDERYQQEFSAALDAIGNSTEKLRKVAADWSFAPKSTEQIAHARIDWEARAKAAEATIATLREQVGRPKVKPLEWDGNGRTWDLYQWSPTYGQGPKPFMLTMGNVIIGWHDTPEEAKAAAQADYEARILSALQVTESTPSKES